MKNFLLTLVACFGLLSAYADGVIYFTNPSNWSTPYVWIWNDDQNYTGGKWPGTAMTKSNDVWKYEWTGSGTPTKVIFSNNGANQTSDLSYTEGATYNLNGPVGAKTYDYTMCYVKNVAKWSNVYIYTYTPAVGNSGTWPGQKLTLKEGETDVYEWIVTSTDTTAPSVGNFIINNGDKDQTGNLNNFQLGATYSTDGSIYTGQTYDHTVYFKNNAGWDNVYVYTWNPQLAGNYPGTKLSTNDQGLYVWTYTSGSQDAPTMDGLQFNNGLSGDQEQKTGDLTYSEGATYVNASTKGVYLVGSFNEWTPSNDWEFIDEGDEIYTGDFTIPNGAQFKIIVNGDWKGAKSGQNSVNLSTGSELELDITDEAGEEANWTITGWNGSVINFTADLNENILTLSYTAPTSAPVMYIVGADINGTKSWDAVEDQKMTYNESSNIYTWSGTRLGSQFKFYNGNWQDNDYNIGAPSNSSAITVGEAFSYATGENSADITLEDNTYIENPTVVLNMDAQTVTVSGNVINTAPYVPEYMILTGSFDDWKNTVTMNKTENGNYQCVYEMPGETSGSDITFKLTTESDKWYGPVNGEYDVTLTDKTATVLQLNSNSGTSNWYLKNWTKSGYITFTVDWTAGTLSLLWDSSSSAINAIEAAPAAEVIYNLQGVRVANPVKGQIYIINGKKVVY